MMLDDKHMPILAHTYFAAHFVCILFGLWCPLLRRQESGSALGSLELDSFGKQIGLFSPIEWDTFHLSVSMSYPLVN